MVKNTNSIDQAWSAIELILHNGLKEYKPKNSKVLQLDTKLQNKNKTGSIAVFRNKLAMSRAHGFVVTSKESLYENAKQLTHWTPNVFNYLTYDDTRSHIKGHTERNLSQINAFIVDIDFKDAIDRDQHIEDVTNGVVIDGHILPTLILKTNKGYQIYYVLERPLYIRRQSNGYMPALNAARKIATNIKQTIQSALPATDVGCNNFGFFRIPRTDNIMFFEPQLTYPIAGLMKWSQALDKRKQVNQKDHLRAISKGSFMQTQQPWFKIMINKTNIKPGVGLGRHNTVLTLSLACYASGIDIAVTRSMMHQFNKNLKLPLSVSDVDRCINDAFSGKYKGASKIYIDTLIETWASPEEKATIKSTTYSTWYKHAKKREERTYSHTDEWISDIINLITKISNDNNPVKLSTRTIRDTLNISSASLNRALKKAIKSNKIIVQKRSGNQASTMATLNMVLKTLIEKRQQKTELWKQYLLFLIENQLNTLSGISRHTDTTHRTTIANSYLIERNTS